jgi:hypothetical protein
MFNSKVEVLSPFAVAKTSSVIKVLYFY